MRVLAHYHFVVMHFYMLMPEGLGALVGFPDWASLGRCRVPFFFMLSGFVAYLAYSKQSSKQGQQTVLGLMNRRLIKYYPAFILGMAISACGPASRAFMMENPTELLTPLFLVQAWLRPWNTVLCNGPSWYLSNLLAFTLAVPLCCAQVRAMKHPAVLLLWLWVVSCGFPLTIHALSFEPLLGKGVGSFLSFCPWCNWHLFLAGIVLARLFGDYADTWRGARLAAVQSWCLGRALVHSADHLFLSRGLSGVSVVVAVCLLAAVVRILANHAGRWRR